jgi:hypothetical protein
VPLAATVCQSAWPLCRQEVCQPLSCGLRLHGGQLAHYVRVRLDRLTIWRVQCTTCKAVFTILPHFVVRYRQMRPEVARNALVATHGGLSLEGIPSSQREPTGVSDGLAHLYNLVPYQRRAQHAGQCGVEVEGGRVPTADWFLNLQILTSGGFR